MVMIKSIFKYLILSLFPIVLIQCQVNQLAQIRREIDKSTITNFLNQDEFNKSRELMYSKLDASIVKNDTIIIVESFPDGTGSSYYSSIYLSNNNSLSCYKASVSYKEHVSVDSLIHYTCFDSALINMIKEGKFAEIKQRGNSSTITPTSTLIINLGVKNKENGRFKFTTIKTQSFAIPGNM